VVRPVVTSVSAYTNFPGTAISWPRLGWVATGSYCRCQLTYSMQQSPS